MLSKKLNITIFTLGHSTHSIEEFLTILKTYNIQELIDIRTIPKSRHNPQFNADALKNSLYNHHIGYRHMTALGGLRRTHKDSINTAWRNASFRGFADYMQTKDFAQGIEKLIEIAHQKTTAIMCAEAVPWRCHRSLIGDALLVRGIIIEDIYSQTSAKPHKLTPWAVVDGVHITYPPKIEK